MMMHAHETRPDGYVGHPRPVVSDRIPGRAVT